MPDKNGMLGAMDDNSPSVPFATSTVEIDFDMGPGCNALVTLCFQSDALLP